MIDPLFDPIIIPATNITIIKQCSRCGKDCRSKRDSYCQRCHKTLKQEYRKRNREFIINYLCENPCTDCGESDILVLEFDHLKDKKSEIYPLIIRPAGLPELIRELEKCEVVCANCHRRRTARRGRYYKYQWMLKQQ